MPGHELYPRWRRPSCDPALELTLEQFQCGKRHAAEDMLSVDNRLRPRACALCLWADDFERVSCRRCHLVVCLMCVRRLAQFNGDVIATRKALFDWADYS
jgi:hypothetical protein